jgi:hypothetical protein
MTGPYTGSLLSKLLTSADGAKAKWVLREALSRLPADRNEGGCSSLPEDLGEQLVEKIRIAPLLGAFCPFHPIAGERRKWAFCTSVGGK